MNKVLDILNEQIIKQLETGVIPWRKPWSCTGVNAPRNYVSKRGYSGINIWLLNQGYKYPYWLTFKQCDELKLSVKGGAKSTTIYFWKFFDAETTGADGKKVTKRIPSLRYYRVFNIEQTSATKEQIEARFPVGEPVVHDVIAEAEAIVAGYDGHPVIKYGGDRACYSPMLDTIHVPELSSYKKPEEYYSTLFHELVHSTGHEKRLNRDGVANVAFFGSETYGREELVAEMGATLLCGHVGIVERTIENSASYCAGWIKNIKENKYALVTASSRASKAFEYILTGKKPEEKSE